MRVLFVMDPIEKLDPPNDTSLYLLRELAGRGHETWAADAGDIWMEGAQVRVHARQAIPRAAHRFWMSKPSQLATRKKFDLILIRKEPPFNDQYLYLTYILEHLSGRLPIVNHPRGIRNVNEKLSILSFPRSIPRSLVSCSAQQILAFQRRICGDVILKPLDEKGGRGVILLRQKTRSAPEIVSQATSRGRKFLMAQQYLKGRGLFGEKRILILNGKILAAYEKRSRKNEFRANLDLGGQAFKTRVSAAEKKLVRELRPYLLKEGLSFVGIDVIGAKLIEINVTCPAGLTDAKKLYPELALVEAWADSLEGLARV